MPLQSLGWKHWAPLRHSPTALTGSVGKKPLEQGAIRPVISISRGWLGWAFGLSILITCALFLDFGLAMGMLRSIPIYSIVIILGLWTVDRCLMAWKWLLLLRGLRVQIEFAALIRFYYQGSFAGLFLPSSLGGDVLRAYWVSRNSGATHEVIAALLMEKLIGFVSALNWAFIGLIVFVFTFLPGAAVRWAMTAFVGALVLNSLFLFSLQPCCARLIQRSLARVPRLRFIGFFQRLCGAYSRYSDCRSTLVWNGLLTIVEHSLQMLIIFAMAKSLGIDVNAILFLAITGIYLLVCRIPLSPDGWGVGEVTAIGLFGLIGVPPESGFALALLAHVLQTIVVLPGLWFLWRSGSGLRP